MCECGFLCVCVCVYSLRIVSPDKILRFFFFFFFFSKYDLP